MATIENEFASSMEIPEEFPLRSISRGAILSVVLALISLLAFFAIPFAGIALLAAWIGLFAYLSIKRYPHELTGKPLALIGMVSGLGIFCGSGLYKVYEYCTEVPEGYVRVEWADLQPEPDTPDQLPQKVFDLEGSQVFIKGYVYPPKEKKTGLSSFVLVRDIGSCCFGGQPKVTHMLQVDIKSDDLIDYSLMPRKVTGTFHIERSHRISKDVGQVIFRIDSDHVK